MKHRNVLSTWILALAAAAAMFVFAACIEQEEPAGAPQAVELDTEVSTDPTDEVEVEGTDYSQYTCSGWGGYCYNRWNPNSVHPCCDGLKCVSTGWGQSKCIPF